MSTTDYGASLLRLSGDLSTMVTLEDEPVK